MLKKFLIIFYRGFSMQRGDLVIVFGSPLEGVNLFGYKNGDIGICMEVKVESRVRTLQVWFAEDKKFWIPELWVKKVGE